MQLIVMWEHSSQPLPGRSAKPTSTTSTFEALGSFEQVCFVSRRVYGPDVSMD